MPDPVTASLIFVGSAVANAAKTKGKEAISKGVWAKLKPNLIQYRPYANDELQRTAYRAYLEATLQSCAALLERKGLRVEAWFKLGMLPEKMADALRSLLHDAPAGVFTEASKQWLETVSHDHISKLKLLESKKLDPPFAYEHEEFAALFKEIELLMEPAEAQDRERGIRAALAHRVLNDLQTAFGEPPQEFAALVTEHWFEYLCAAFQFHINHKPELATAFETRLLAKLVARGDWENQLADFGGESSKRIEAAQEWLLQEQREGFERIESLVTLLLPLLSFASDEAARNETLTLLIRAESRRVIDVVQDESEKTRSHADLHFGDLKASINRLAPQPSIEPEPLIHTLPTQQEIEGREEECATILRAMSESKKHVLAFAAPGGFGKTALLAKVIQEISADGKTFVERVTLPSGETIETRTGALLHVDCRNDVTLSTLFANAGRIIGQEQAFQDIFNSDAGLSDKLQEIFGRLSANAPGRIWFVFDNFEPLLNENGEIADAEVSDFFSAIFAGGHSVYALISTRDLPRFSPREKVMELEAVGGSLFDGLPLVDCVAYLKKNGVDQGLGTSAEEIDAVLEEFAKRIHRIPMALVWAIGYLNDTGYSLKEVLERHDLFADFDRFQAKDAVRYADKGLKRLHHEQLKIQTSETLPLLRLLAFFKRAVPKGALAHLQSEIELNKTLTRLERNRLITRKESPDAYTRYLNDPLAINLYSLHPVICENEFFDTLPDKEALYETAAIECWRRGASAYEVNRFAYGVDLYDCAEKLYEHLTTKLKRPDLLNNYAGMLINKGIALRNLTQLRESIAEYDKAISVFERLANENQQAHLINHLANAYANKGVALENLTKLAEALVEYDKAIAILERLVNDQSQVQMANDLASVYMNKGIALKNLTKLPEALAEYDKAIAIRERLINEDQQMHLAKDLAAAYANKGAALEHLTKVPEALMEYDKAIAIFECLVNKDQQSYLANDLASAYMNKSIALQRLAKLPEALAEYDKAIVIRERLVNDEQQTHLSNDLAAAYMNKAATLQNLTKLREAIAENDKAIAIIERLVNEDQQAHLAYDLAMVYMNKGVALKNLTKLQEAIAEYDKTIAILERLLHEDQQTRLVYGLAAAYQNKGVAFKNLERLAEAIAEYDKGITILEPLVNDDHQVHLANDLATAFMNKAFALGQQQEWDSALSSCEKSLQARTLCVEQLNMFWIMPWLLQTLRFRLVTLLHLQRFGPAALDVLWFISLFVGYGGSDAIDDGLKEAAGEEFAKMIDRLRALTTEQRELLYAELGDEAEAVRSLVAESVD
jgi:tetratricopeptide (TPR) repeat protein